MSKNKETAKKYENNKGKNRGYNRSRRGSGNKPDPKEVGGRDATSMNDIGWYALNTQMLRDSADFPYVISTGLDVKMENSPSLDFKGEVNKNTHDVVPGIFTEWVVLDPLSESGSDAPANVASRQIVSYIRSANSGAKFYDAVDMMIRLLAEGELLAQLNWMMRLYATVNTYSAYNRYLPETLLAAQRVSFSSLSENLANFRARINQLIYRAAEILYIPGNMSLYDRWQWLFFNYYIDSETPKDQIYMLAPLGFHTFEIDPETSKGMLKFHSWTEMETVNENGRAVLTWQGLLQGMEAMFQPLIRDAEMCYIQGDMMKYWGPSRLSLSLIPDNLLIQMKYDPLVLNQIKNSRCIVPTNSANPYDLIQDAGGTYLTHKRPKRELGSAGILTLNQTDYSPDPDFGDDYNITKYMVQYYNADHVMDTRNPSPTAVDNMENSRLCNMALRITQGANNAYQVVPTTGSEIVSHFEITYRSYNADTDTYSTRYRSFNSVMFAVIGDRLNGTGAPACSDFNSSSRAIIEGFANLQQFKQLLMCYDYAPNIYYIGVLCSYQTATYSIQAANYLPDMRLCNIATVSAITMNKMNICAMLSELSVGGIQPR